MSDTYIVHGRYYGGRKFRVKASFLSAGSAVSIIMANGTGVRVAITLVKG